MADKIFLDNDSTGFGYSEAVFNFPQQPTTEASAHGFSGTTVQIGQVRNSGRVYAFELGIVNPALSASGFVSGTVDCDLLVNGSSILSTKPAFAMVATSALVVRGSTNGTSAANITFPVINTASAAVVPGDQICVTFNARSVGSAAAGAAGKGLVGFALIRPAAV